MNSKLFPLAVRSAVTATATATAAGPAAHFTRMGAFRLVFAASFAVLVVACGNSGCAIKKNSPVTDAPGVGADGRGGPLTNSASAASAPKASPVNPRSILAARIKPDWQKVFIELAMEIKAVEAWGLFSEGGWVDDGQTMVFVLPDGTARVDAVLPGGRAADTLKPVSAADVLLLRRDLSDLDGLEDHVETVFDAVQYEAVHLVPLASDSRLDVKTRIMIVHPGEKKAPKHLATLRTLKAIRQARAGH